MSGDPNEDRGIVLVSDPQSFFAESLDEATKQCGFVLLPTVRNYLVEVMQRFLTSENLFQVDEHGKMQSETRAEMFFRAAHADAGKRIEILKRLGDTSLYLTGFFAPSLQKKIVDIDYYVEMGALAYHQLSSAIPDKSFSHLYGDISHRFTKYVDLLTLISHQTMPKGEVNLIALYESYLKNHSIAAKNKLEELGVISPVKVVAGQGKQ